MKNKQEKKTCNDKGEWGNFIYNGNSLKDILFWNFMRKFFLIMKKIDVRSIRKNNGEFC